MFKQLTQKIQYAAFTFPVAVGATNTSESGDIAVSPGGNFSNLSSFTISGIISGLLTLILSLVSLVFFFMLVMGGARWIMSSGDEKAVAAARSQITNALIGLAIVFASYAILNLISTLFGVKLLDGFMINPL